MKATELRIGNLIFQSGQITTIENISRSINDWERVNNKRLFDCTPIPLTDEWLLDFGFSFKEDDLGFYFKWELKDDKKEFVFYVPGDEHPHRHKYYCGGWNGEIKYVHQLQNLYFALTGEELTLKP